MPFNYSFYVYAHPPGLSLKGSYQNTNRLYGDHVSVTVEQPAFVKWYRKILVNSGFCKKKLDTRLDTHCIKTDAQLWCERRDLNPYESPHTPLKRARLPIPPLSHIHIQLYLFLSSALRRSRRVCAVPLAIPKIFCGLEHRKILTAAPFRTRFIRHRRRFVRNAADSATLA